MGCNPRPTVHGTLRPLFGLNPMRPRGAKGATTYPQRQVGPKPQVGPPEQILAPNLTSPRNGQKDSRTQIGKEPHIGHFQPLAFGNHLRLRKVSPSPMYSVPWIQEWCIYGIIYHYSPILLRNTMVMVSGPNVSISNQVPKSITNFEGILLSQSIFQFLAATRRPFKDPNHLALQDLGFTLFQD
ncbi:hypothetical protein O181_006929 [Austropuccinia psidii MF-1]|uniref:Uncharacterized protein n=1 Tax=Austropuccinia psidii MF-1 TaxID=1389203 RepID=A0A9Q3GHD1_9BASI|nr:hypothetical protein [Austropuccinia psidii MF-1]